MQKKLFFFRVSTIGRFQMMRLLWKQKWNPAIRKLRKCIAGTKYLTCNKKKIASFARNYPV